ncbi:MAG: hypothetical protein ACXWHA_00505, partial [Usitatibacter sp.]
NTLSDVPAPTPTVTPFSVAPTDVTLNSCTDVANVALVGGSGVYMATSGSSTVTAIVTGSTGSINRTAHSGTAASPISVAFSDGQSLRQVTVNLGPGALSCP